MIRVVILFVLVLAVAAGSYGIVYRRAMKPVSITPDGTAAELAWLKHEFALTPDQYEKVLVLHNAYRPVCAEHCKSYLATHDRLAELLKQQEVWSADAAAVIAERARIQVACHTSMLKYAYDVAACMQPAQGRRYLEMIKMHLVEGDPAAMFAAAR